jgi:outer membrane protein TolC
MRIPNPRIIHLGVLALWAGTSAAQTIVGVVTDGPEARSRAAVPLDALEREIQSLAGDEFAVRLPEDKRLDGGWDLGGVREALRRQLADPEVDIIIATGAVASNEVARMELGKPVIAAVTADAELQELPIDAETGSSGKRNFVYLSNFRSIDEELQAFRDSVEFEHLAALVDALTLESIPMLSRVKTAEIEDLLGIRITLIPVTDSETAALTAIPADADAVYVTPLLRLDEAAMIRLADGLIERRLPSFSLLGRGELEYGLLMATGGREEDNVRYTRRLALNLQRILLGENAAEIPVSFQESRRLTINMRTAHAIGFSPRYAVLTPAERLYEELESGEPLSLAQAMTEALEANLNLRVGEVDPQVAQEGVAAARSVLLPQLGFGFQGTQIDEDRANPLFQAERSVDAQLTARQLIYSEDDRANLSSAQFLAGSADYEYRVLVLDTLQAAARAYLSVLRARALEAVRRSNLEVTRANLELANLRESIGISGRGDVLRWESQFATDLQNLITAEADRRSALTDLNRILHRPQTASFTASGADVAQSIALFQDDRFRAFIDNATVWETFQDYAVAKTLQTAPELRSLDQVVAAQERQVVSSERKYYVPELALVGTAGSNISRGGGGSDLTGLGLDDRSWMLALTANWPLFTSGALRSRLNQDRLGLRRLQSQRLVLEEQLEARTRVALHRASGTYPAVELSRDAARAAQENLALVTDSYSQGVLSVTDLIDAQDAALAAELRAADAQYAYLIDLVDVLRSTSDFSLLLDPGSVEAWFQEVEDYFQAQAVVPRR